jgi:tetratricopeptide (TPR) repeat protein
LEDYQKAFPLDLSATILLGQCYYAADQREKALQVWNWIKQSGGRKVKRKLALVLSTIPEKQQDAVELIKRTKDKEIGTNRRFDVSYYLKYKDYYQTLGRIYLHRQKFKDAADYLMLTYERSRREQPRTYDQTYLLCLGYALAKTGRYRSAIDFSLKGAASLDPAAYQAFHAVNYGLSMLGYE